MLRNGIVVSVVMTLILICLSLFGGCDNAEQEEDSLLLSQYSELEQSYSSLSSQYETLREQCGELASACKDLENEYQKSITAQNDFDALTSQYDQIQKQYDDLLTAYRNLENQYQESISEALMPPYISINDRKVSICFRKLDDSIGVWEVPFDSLEAAVQRGFLTREVIPDTVIPMIDEMYKTYQPICAYTDCTNFTKDYLEAVSDLEDSSVQTVTLTARTGTKHLVVDCRPFIRPDVFTTVIATLFSENANEDNFIREVWNIVTQLNTYSEEIEETPRYPLETMLAGGGDCEDTAILFASMIEAAPVDWDVELVYLDSNNPTNPQEVNHLMVSIDTGSRLYLVETTNDQVMQPFNNIDGWYLEI